MTSNINLAAVISIAILCNASPLLAQDGRPSNEPGLVFIPQAKQEEPAKANRSGPRAGRKTGVPAGAKAKPLPDSAASTGEVHGDWSVNCGTNGGVKFCTITQAQINKDSGQRVFAIELRPSRDGSNQGTILMPLGLKLETGLVMKVDNEEQKLRFSTCLAVGCLIPLVIPTAALETIRKAKTFTVEALSVSEQTVTFNVSLNGFGMALDRANQLGS
jgi:invasion protein IalB